MKKKILMVVNPISGAVDKSEFIQATNLFVKNLGHKLIIYRTSGKNDITKIKALYERYTPERVIVTGGDGTIKMVAEAMENHDVTLGILPGGSANGLAVDLNLPTSLEENLQVAFGNNYMEMDMIVINGKKSIHLSDLGLNAELVKNYEKSSTHGFWGYISQAFTTLIDLDEPFKATIKANKKTIKCVARMIVIANSKKYGTGVVINPDGAMDDGKFELVILKNLDLILFAKIITGNIPINTEDIEIISTSKATIKTSSPVTFQMDGEYCGAETSLDINILPKKMKVAIP